MRRTGWGGHLPVDDDQAVARILAAGREAIAESGSELRLTDVARKLNVTRQTVYRYFPGTEALMHAVAIDAGQRIADRLAAAVADIARPEEAVVEMAAITVETVQSDPTVAFLLGEGSRAGVFTGSITDETSAAYAISLLRGSAVDWEGLGFDDTGVEELTGWALMVVDALLRSGRRILGDQDVRGYLERWLAPAVREAVAARA